MVEPVEHPEPAKQRTYECMALCWSEAAARPRKKCCISSLPDTKYSATINNLEHNIMPRHLPARCLPGLLPRAAREQQQDLQACHPHASDHSNTTSELIRIPITYHMVAARPLPTTTCQVAGLCKVNPWWVTPSW